ncbi:hypothetical protein MKEN_01287500 [Mycena kentingensis (nom. inval.)]|nr:hypothetical protein MKEN_01287500 [Mycena kentingensis (nom. inval.)]
MSAPNSGKIFNVPEPTSADQTTAAQAQAEAKTATIAREVEINAEHAKDVAENAAFVAQSHGPDLTGQTPTDRLQTEASIKTGQAVDQGKETVAQAQAAGAGYVQQAKDMASSAMASAQSTIPPGSGPNGAHTASDVVSGIPNRCCHGRSWHPNRRDCSVQCRTADLAASYLPGTTTTQSAPVEGKDANPPPTVV